MPVLVEACIDTVASAVAAERGGAQRVELCAALADGGTTPSAGMIAAVRAAVRIPVFVIVRPRGGGFVYSAAELDVMARDIDAALGLDVDGIVLGVLRADGRLDVPRMRAFVRAANDLPVTLHRAFDGAPDLREALDDAIDAGVSRVLTSGGAPTALAGVDAIARLVAHADDRITIMAGGGLRAAHAGDVVRHAGVREVHVRGTRLETAPGTTRPVRLRKALPDDEGAWEETDEGAIRGVVAAVSPAGT